MVREKGGDGLFGEQGSKVVMATGVGQVSAVRRSRFLEGEVATGVGRMTVVERLCRVG